MFCPKCRYEYNPGITICPDCNEPLVDQLPPEEEEMDELEYAHRVTVLTSSDHRVILMARLILEEEGIRWFSEGNETLDVFGGGSASLNPLIGRPIGIQVLEKDAEQARELLADLETAPQWDAIPEEDDE